VAHPGACPQVCAEGRLTIGSRRHEGEAPAGAKETGAERGHDITALVLEGHRWHRDEHLVRQQAHQGVEIGGLVSVDELCDDRLLGG
jgi:hypothetical protein